MADTPTDVTSNVPRHRMLSERRARLDYQRRYQEAVVQLAGALSENRQLREARPDAAAVLDGKRHTSELAHALGSVLVVLERQGKTAGNTAHYVRQLLVNKGFNPDNVQVIG